MWSGLLTPHIKCICNCVDIIHSFRTAPPRVTGVRVFDGQAVLWEPPNGIVTSYELTVTRGQDTNTVTTTLPYYVIQSQDVPDGSGSFTVKVTT